MSEHDFQLKIGRRKKRTEGEIHATTERGRQARAEEAGTARKGATGKREERQETQGQGQRRGQLFETRRWWFQSTWLLGPGWVYREGRRSLRIAGSRRTDREVRAGAFGRRMRIPSLHKRFVRKNLYHASGTGLEPAMSAWPVNGVT